MERECNVRKEVFWEEVTLKQSNGEMNQKLDKSFSSDVTRKESTQRK